MTAIPVADRIWQGRVSNPSERSTGGGEAPDMRARLRGIWGPAPPENLKIWHFLIHFPDISGHYKLYDWVCFYDMSGVDFADDTISIVHRNRKVEVAPNWATVYFQKGHPKQRAGVRTPWTPALDPPLQYGTEYVQRCLTSAVQLVSSTVSYTSSRIHTFVN